MAAVIEDSMVNNDTNEDLKADVQQENGVNQSKDENDVLNQSKDENDVVNQSKDENDVVNQSKDENDVVNQSKDENDDVNQSKDENDDVNQSKDDNIVNSVGQIKIATNSNNAVSAHVPSNDNSEVRDEEKESIQTETDNDVPLTAQNQSTDLKGKNDEIKQEVKPNLGLRNMLEDIEEGELDYEEEEGELQEEPINNEVVDDDDYDDEDLPDLPEYDPIAQDNKTKQHSAKRKEEEEDGEILSDGEAEEREDGEILDDDETGQVYICVDPVNDKWKKVSKEEKKRLQELEDGQIDDPEEPVEPPPSAPPHTTGRFIPRTLCKYFHNGLCRWGSTCRFLHPGINDKGIPTDVQPTWNATAGNYVMHRPPGMYPNAFGKAPAPMECINIPVMPAPVVDMSLVSTHPELVNVLPVSVLNASGIHPGDLSLSKKESAWERGLRRAKEIKEAASRRREEDEDFEEKRRNLRIAGADDHHHDEDSDDTEPPPAWSHRQSKSEYYEKKYENKNRGERYGDRYAKKFEPDKRRGSTDMPFSSRSSDLPPNHPLRREERQRYRERDKREKEDREGKLHRDMEESRVKALDAHVKLDEPTPHMPMKAPTKTFGATEWHDPWMRSQPTQSTNQVKPDVTKQSGVEAVSDSDSSSSDSDSDSDSSSSDSDSGSGSSSSDNENKISKEERNKERYRLKMEKRRADEINKPKAESSYEEWKRQQALKAQQKLEAKAKEDPRKMRELEEKKRLSQLEPMPRSISNVPLTKKPMQGPLKFQVSSNSKVRPPVHKDPPVTIQPVRNIDKFDSPKRNTKPDSDTGSDDSDSNSDSDSGSDSSDSDSDDSDTDSESDNDAKSRMQAMAASTNNVTQPVPVAKPFKTAPPLDTNARKDIKLNLTEKPKTEPPVVGALTAGTKRPARKDELLKELKAVEDAIARKRAKID